MIEIEGDPMRIYLPHPFFEVNANILEEREIAKQCNIAATILSTIKEREKGWQWHPGVKMWVGNENWLAQYAFRLNLQWQIEGYPDISTKVINDLGFINYFWKDQDLAGIEGKPWWWGHEKFHASNRSELLRINPNWYGQFFQDANNIIAWWPTSTVDKFIFGPHPAPGNKFDYMVDGKSFYKPVKVMPNEEFIIHANNFHNLMPDIKGGIKPNTSDQMLANLRALHDRFHTKRVYNSHDHH